MAIEHAINMLLARVAFDLLRSPRFKAYVMAYVQKKLDDLKVPDYINALQVGSQAFWCICCQVCMLLRSLQYNQCTEGGLLTSSANMLLDGGLVWLAASRG